jgi:fucose 4-O-acetylase-like acetyltransferase
MRLTGIQSKRHAGDLLSRDAAQPSSLQPAASGEMGVSQAAVRPQRIAFLDVAKGIGIILVVIGHSLGGLYDDGLVTPESAGWLGFYLIYCFHMPLFFFLSGSLVEGRIARQPGRFLRSNLTRIAYPYFLWGAVNVGAMLLASGLINHRLLTSPAQAFAEILWKPPGPFWFLFVLFFLHLTALLTLRSGGKLLLVAAAAALYLLCATWQPAADFLWNYVAGTNILFYVLGVCIGQQVVNWRGRIPQPYTAAAIAAVIFFASAWTGWRTEAEWYSYVTLPAAFAGTIAVLLLSRSDLLNGSQWLSYIGRRAISIYVMHILFVASTRILLAKIFHIDSVAIILPVIVAMGVVMPLIIDRVTVRLRIQPALGLG